MARRKKRIPSNRSQLTHLSRTLNDERTGSLTPCENEIKILSWVHGTTTGAVTVMNKVFSTQIILFVSFSVIPFTSFFNLSSLQ